MAVVLVFKTVFKTKLATVQETGEGDISGRALLDFVLFRTSLGKVGSTSLKTMDASGTTVFVLLWCLVNERREELLDYRRGEKVGG